ncbi:MAG TPA: YceI family protein [Longimicrobiaceae bacterium]|nr:YceI family protein [Longimicrobiaceae bacterium]
MAGTQNATVAGTTTWTIDPTHTLVELSAKHMMITTVKGRFSGVTGTLVVDEQNPDNSSVEVEIETATIDTGTAQRDEHLRSADFLDVETYPKITFRSRRVEGAINEEGDQFRVYGALTIRDTTREVMLNATYEGRGDDPWGGERVSFSATTKIDRRDFGLTWNVALEAGGILVSNEVRISLDVQAVRAE